MKIFTVGNGDVMEGAVIGTVTIKSADVQISAVCVGEEGRGRKFSYIPISGVQEDQKKVTNVKLSQTRTGKPKFIAINPEEDDNTTDECIIVFLHTAGYRGGAGVTGDIREDVDFGTRSLNFPGEVLCEGAIAQGAAGRVGGNPQFIAKLKKGDVFRIARSGRLYGNPSNYYGCFDGHKVILVTWQEREALELWFD
jgi:hypothetical protein